MKGPKYTKPHRTQKGAVHKPWDKPRPLVCQTCYGMSWNLKAPCSNPDCGLKPGPEKRRARDVLSSNFEAEVSGW